VEAGSLPDGFSVAGAGLGEMDTAAFRDLISEGLALSTLPWSRRQPAPSWWDGSSTYKPT